ncbi:hypothetical protein HYT33_02375 [Candidatus Roizmanbacteria bacterium]|nr:hypothetical protein [Candidatus Roizmanbacteria bacterium]
MRKKGKLFPIVLVVFLILVIVVGLWWWKGKTTTKPLGSQIYQQVQNPLKGKIPETNPFTVKTNPFKNIYPNPFR